MSLVSRYRTQLNHATLPVLERMAFDGEPYDAYPEVVDTVFKNPRSRFQLSLDELLRASETPMEQLDTTEAFEDAYAVSHAVEEIVDDRLREDAKQFLETSRDARRSVSTHRMLSRVADSSVYDGNLTALVEDVYAFSDAFDYDISDPGTYELPNGEELFSAPEVSEKEFHEGHVRGAELLKPFGGRGTPQPTSTVYAWVWEEHTDIAREVDS